MFFGYKKVARLFVALILVERAFQTVFRLIKFLLSACRNGPFFWVDVGNAEFHQILFLLKYFVGDPNASVCLLFIGVDGVHWLDFLTA